MCYAAWNDKSMFGARTLYLLFLDMCCGKAPPLSFNDSSIAFAIKDDKPEDPVDTIRAAKDLRPIGLKNTDNKIIAGVINGAIAGPFASAAVRIQRGFVRGRQIIDNVVELDAAARIQANDTLIAGRSWLPTDPHHSSPSSADLSVLAFWDFAAAFPSVAHEWLMLCCAASGLPTGLCTIIGLFYSNACIFVESGGKSQFLCWLRSGIIQGCPLSGFLYALCADPFLKKMVADVVGHEYVAAVPSEDLTIAEVRTGVIRACADDVGGAFANLTAFSRTVPAFNCAANFANLHLKGSKCVVVPTSHKCDDTCQLFTTNWLHYWIPHWRNFLIQSTSKYLGFQLGPTSGSLQWSNAVAKYKARVRSIASSGAPPSVATLLYNSQAISVLGYIAQMCHLPSGFAAIERGQLHALLHMPTNSSTLAFFFNAKHWGMLPIRSALATNLASLMRASLSTVSVWPHWSSAVSASANLCLSVGDLTAGRDAPSFWDSCSLSTTLARAAAGFVGTRYSCAGSAALAAISSFQGPSPKIQKLCYDAILPLIAPNEALKLFSKRISGPLGVSFPRGGVNWTSVQQACARLSPKHASNVVKTWLNAWCTSDRFHETSRQSCIFGCSFPDKLDHYLVCPAMRVALANVSLGALGSSPLQLLALADAVCINLKLLSISFSLYHTLRFEFHQLLARARDTLDFSPVQRCACRLADSLDFDFYATTPDTSRHYRDAGSGHCGQFEGGM
jgi:hypothetical protein